MLVVCHLNFILIVLVILSQVILFPIIFSDVFIFSSPYLLSKSNKSTLCFIYHMSLTYLNLIFSNIWCTPFTFFVERYCYFVIFIDHFTKFIRFYTMCIKLEVYGMFFRVKKLVENQFCTYIKSLQTIYGDKFKKLHTYFHNSNIFHHHLSSLLNVVISH